MKLIPLPAGFVFAVVLALTTSCTADQPPLILPQWLRSLIVLQATDIARLGRQEERDLIISGAHDFLQRVDAGKGRETTSPFSVAFLDLVKVYAGEPSPALSGDLPLENWVRVRPVYGSLAGDPGEADAFPGHYRIIQATMRRMEGLLGTEHPDELPEEDLQILWGNFRKDSTVFALKCFPKVPPDLDFFCQALRTWEASKKSRFAENCEGRLHFVVHHLRELDHVKYAPLYTDVVRLLVKSEMKTTSKMRQTILGLGDNSFNRSPEDAESARILLSHIHLSDVEGDDRKIIKLLRKLARSAPLTEEGKTAADLLEVHGKCPPDR